MITKRLVDAMGGAIGYESQAGEGSTFWVELAQATPVLAVDRSPRPAATADPSPRTQWPRVLVAEDDAPNQAVLKLQLASLGCEVEVVNDGAAALARWSSCAYDLILSDLDMRLMDGRSWRAPCDCANGCAAATFRSSRSAPPSLATSDCVARQPAWTTC